MNTFMEASRMVFKSNFEEVDFGITNSKILLTNLNKLLTTADNGEKDGISQYISVTEKALESTLKQREATKMMVELAEKLGDMTDGDTTNQM